MINKIKDKQTGEYHDIGNLKCKLVAEGTLELMEEDNSLYKKIYNFENDKMYILNIFEEQDIVYNTLILASSEGFNSTIIRDHYNSGVNIYITNIGINLGGIAFVGLSSNEVLQGYENMQYKIYELPFALEV